MPTADPVPLTARLVDGGGRYFDPSPLLADRTGGTQLARGMCTVKASHVAVVCERCAFRVAIPLRIGRYFAEGIRRQHVEYVHRTEVAAGTMTVELPEKLAMNALAAAEWQDRVMGPMFGQGAEEAAVVIVATGA